MYTDSTRQPILNDQWYVHLETGTKYPPGYPRNLIPGLHPVMLVPAPTGNVMVSGFTINENFEQVWQYREKTEDEIAAEALESVRAKRAGEYPPIGDQLDAIWKELNYRRLNGDALTQDADDMLGKILAIKNKYPKPEEKA